MLGMTTNSYEKEFATQVNTTSSLGHEPAGPPAVANFRAFSGEGYGASIIDENPEHPLLVFCLVSFRNAIFQNPKTVSQMIRDTDKEFEQLQRFTPTFYLYTEKLQNMTECLLPKDTAKLTVVTKKWSDAFKTTERELKSERSKSTSPGERCILQDEKLENHPYFLILTNFVEQALEQEEFSSRLFEVIGLYLANNSDKIKIAEDLTDSLNLTEKRDILRQYLIREYAYFLLLGLLETYQRADDAFDQIKITGINIPVSITQEDPVQPIMIYPVSASSSSPTSLDGLAAKSLSLYLDLQKFYIEKCKENTDFPTMRRGLKIIDIRVNHKKTPRQQKKEDKQEAKQVQKNSSTAIPALTTDAKPFLLIEEAAGRTTAPTTPPTSRPASKTGSPTHGNTRSSPPIAITTGIELVVAEAILNNIINNCDGAETLVSLQGITYHLTKMSVVSEKRIHEGKNDHDHEHAITTLENNVKSAINICNAATDGETETKIDLLGYWYRFHAARSEKDNKHSATHEIIFRK